MAFCTNCGAQIETGAKFCPECGAKAEIPVEPAANPAYTPANTYYGSEPTPSTGGNTPPTGTYSSEPAGFYSSNTPSGGYSYDPAAGAPGSVPPASTRDIPGGSTPPPKNKKLLPIILIAVGVIAIVGILIAILGGKGGKKSEDPNCGVYKATYGSMFGIQVEVTDVWTKGFTIELKDGGKCRVEVDGQGANCRYTIEKDGEIEIKGGGMELEGTVFNGVLTLEDVLGTGMELIFKRDGATAPASSTVAAPAGTTVQTADYSWWDGEWYGWWVVYDAGGEYEELVGTASDTCATITVTGDTGLIDIWDDMCEEGTNCGYIDVQFFPGATDKGMMVSTGGSFYSTDVTWVVDPGTADVSRFENMIYISGIAEEDTGDWFEYKIYLRPWGMSWEDVRSDSCEDMPYSDMMPIGYDDWYVPHMNSTMPEYIDLYF